MDREGSKLRIGAVESSPKALKALEHTLHAAIEKKNRCEYTDWEKRCESIVRNRMRDNRLVTVSNKKLNTPGYGGASTAPKHYRRYAIAVVVFLVVAYAVGFAALISSHLDNGDGTVSDTSPPAPSSADAQKRRGDLRGTNPRN
jgi:hypothetical protein